jgi:hypothetical protein
VTLVHGLRESVLQGDLEHYRSEIGNHIQFGDEDRRREGRRLGRCGRRSRRLWRGGRISRDCQSPAAQ